MSVTLLHVIASVFSSDALIACDVSNASISFPSILEEWGIFDEDHRCRHTSERADRAVLKFRLVEMYLKTMIPIRAQRPAARRASSYMH